jgi:hypothetical protein
MLGAIAPVKLLVLVHALFVVFWALIDPATIVKIWRSCKPFPDEQARKKKKPRKYRGFYCLRATVGA